MSEKLPYIKLDNYQRLFRLRGGILYLISDVFGGYYKNLDCLLTGINGTWTSYLPKKIVEKTLKDGLELFSSEQLFSQYVRDFNEYRKRSTDFFEATLKKNQLTKKETVKSFALISEMFSFYSKTEFFYTDKVYMSLENNPSKELARNVEVFEEVKNNGRQYLNQLIFSGGYADQLIGLLSKQFSVPVEELRMYKVSESAWLFDNNKIAPESLKARAEAFIQYAEEGKMSYFEGEQAKQIVSEFIRDSSEKTKEVRGTIANRGMAQGRIKVIPSDYYSDFSILAKLFSEMGEGDILIAETTSPELMPACKKAGAIVTDQGGLLSHAAIVSRELNIPCIVGTGNATEIFKNGDLVEVDGEKGIVKILNKK